MPLHPQAVDFIARIAAANVPGWHEMTPAEGREVFAGLIDLFGTGPDLHHVEDQCVSDVAARIYRPHERTPLPAVVYFHGGGWVLGNLDTHDALCRRLARQSGCVLVSVDYRLAPEYKYPAAVEDAYAVTKYLADHAVEYGLDADRIVVAGDSAGGNLAVNVARMARDRNGPAIQAQLLIYPVIERNFETSSYLAFATDHGLTRAAMQWFWQQYVSESTEEPTYAALENADLADLPPAHVITAEFDVLRDEGESFAARLTDAGVPTTLKRYNGMLHGFIHMNAIFDDGLKAIDDIAKLLND